MFHILESQTRALSTHGKKRTKPALKWAGGKSQLLSHLLERVPLKYNNYIEPFVGGGALFFALSPEKAVVSDSNPELINFYKCLAEDHEAVLENLDGFKNTKEFFYEIRALDFSELDKFYAASRTLFLNKTCFNGLYRVNKKGFFNVPYGDAKNPRYYDLENIEKVSKVLKNTTIFCGEYDAVLKKFAKKGDLVFLDPPYLPISKNADFKRYTKKQFNEDDHKALANEVKRLVQLGCHVILTNSNHPLALELYSDYKIDVFSSKRNISSNGKGRCGQDVIVNIPFYKRINLKHVPTTLPEQTSKFPSTRYMGSKEKLLPYIHDVASHFQFESVLDLFSGTGVVSYLFKTLGKRVVANDYMAMNATFSKALIQNKGTTLSPKDLKGLLSENLSRENFVSTNFKGLYFDDLDNSFIDRIRGNLKNQNNLNNPYKVSLAKAALIRACLKKRPRGIFTYVGHRYDDGRKDLKKTLEEHFLEAVDIFNSAVFDNGQKNKALKNNAMKLRTKADLVYLDPPYYSPLSDNEYVRRYHFVEGIACDWQGVDMQWETKTKKFKNYPSPFSSEAGAFKAFDKLFCRYKDSTILLSYSSNSLPGKDDLIRLLGKHKTHVEVIDIDHTYSFGTQSKTLSNNKVTEFLFIGY